MTTPSSKKGQKTKGTMSTGSVRPSTEDLLASKPERLAPRGRPKALTNRDYFAGQFASILFDKNFGEMTLEDIKKEAYRMADFMTEEDNKDEA